MRRQDSTFDPDKTRENAVYQKARSWLFANWSEDDRHLVMDAIRESVSAELCERDTRCYDIHPNGQVTDVAMEADGVTPKAVSVDPAKAASVHAGCDHTHETKRRWRAWVALYPKSARAHDWVQLISEDEGLGSDGQPLCQEHGGRKYRNPRSKNYRSGFVEELPEWLRKPPPAWCGGQGGRKKAEAIAVG
jgi:hypothetical protein